MSSLNVMGMWKLDHRDAFKRILKAAEESCSVVLSFMTLKNKVAFTAC